MKTFTTIASALVLMSTVSASAAVVGNAGTSHWTGNEDSTVLPDMCDFKSNSNGHMDLDTTTGIWATTNPAEVTIEYRNINSIVIEADDSKQWQTSHSYDTDGKLVYSLMQSGQPGNGVIHGHNIDPADTHGEVFDADVDYNGTTVVFTQDGGKVTGTRTSAGGGTFTANVPRWQEFAGFATIEIRGTAKPTGEAIYSANNDYHVPHKITCVQ